MLASDLTKSTTSAALYLFLVTVQSLLDVTSGRGQLFDTRPFLIKTRRADPSYSEQYFTPQNFNPDEDIQSYQPIDRFDQYSNDAPNILTDSYGNQVHHQVNFPPDSHYETSSYPDPNTNSISDDIYNTNNQYNRFGNSPSSNRGSPFNNNVPPGAPLAPPTQPPIQNYPPPPPNGNQFGNNYRNNYGPPPEQQSYPPDFNAAGLPQPNPGPPPNTYQNLPTYPPYTNFDQNNYQKQPPQQQPPVSYKQPYGNTQGIPQVSNGFPVEEYPTDNPPIGYPPQSPPTGPGTFDYNINNYQQPQQQPPNLYGVTNQNYNPPRPFDVPSPSSINSLQYSPNQNPSGTRNNYDRNPFQNNYPVQPQYGLNVGRGIVNPSPPPPPLPPPLPAQIPGNLGYSPSPAIVPPVTGYDPRYQNFQDLSQNDFSNYQPTQQQPQVVDSPRQNFYYEQSQTRGKSYRRPFMTGSSNYLPRGLTKSQRKTYSRGRMGGSFRQASIGPPPSFDPPGRFATLPQKQAPDGSYIY